MLSFLQSKGWKTIVGVIGTAGTVLLSPAVLGVLPVKAATVITTIFGVLTVLGIYHRVASTDNAVSGGASGQAP